MTLKDTSMPAAQPADAPAGGGRPGGVERSQRYRSFWRKLEATLGAFRAKADVAATLDQIILILLRDYRQDLHLVAGRLSMALAVASTVMPHVEAGRLRALASGSAKRPRIAPDKSDGVPDPDWAKRVCALIKQGSTQTLIKEATQEQMLSAGNVGGELLDWIAMLGAVGENRPKFVTPQMEQGHAYAAWNWG